jgi:hypothetical protein
VFWVFATPSPARPPCRCLFVLGVAQSFQGKLLCLREGVGGMIPVRSCSAGARRIYLQADVSCAN